MVPNFRRFAMESGFGDVPVLENALATAWTWLETEKVSSELSELRMAVENQAPDKEDFKSVYTSAALDSVSAISSLLDALELNVADVSGVATLARDSIDLFVQDLMNLDPSESQFEEKIQQHEIMRNEMLMQQQQLKELQDLRGSRKEVVTYFKNKYLPSKDSLYIPAVTG